MDIEWVIGIQIDWKTEKNAQEGSKYNNIEYFILGAFIKKQQPLQHIRFNQRNPQRFIKANEFHDWKRMRTYCITNNKKYKKKNETIRYINYSAPQPGISKRYFVVSNQNASENMMQIRTFRDTLCAIFFHYFLNNSRSTASYTNNTKCNAKQKNKNVFFLLRFSRMAQMWFMWWAASIPKQPVVECKSN